MERLEEGQSTDEMLSFEEALEDPDLLASVLSDMLLAAHIKYGNEYLNTVLRTVEDQAIEHHHCKQ